MPEPNPEIEAALRRLLIDLERPPLLDEWRDRRRPPGDRVDRPKAA